MKIHEINFWIHETPLQFMEVHETIPWKASHWRSSLRGTWDMRRRGPKGSELDDVPAAGSGLNLWLLGEVDWA